MAVDTSKIGAPTSRAAVTVERSVLTSFARALKDESPVYADATAAREAGFDGIPAPPTYPIAMEFWGKYPEDQPADAGDTNMILAEIVGPLMAKGGIILHGEQEFTYHRPIQAGDKLLKEGKVADIYEKETSSALMTFIVTEDTWSDAATGEPVATARMNLIHRGAKEG
jgi:acyl dehydratase